jgi:hypothetical protein
MFVLLENREKLLTISRKGSGYIALYVAETLACGLPKL